MAVLVVAVLFYLYKITLYTYINLEEKYFVSNLKLAEKIILREVNYVDATCKDYAIWDDSYEFLETRDEEYLKTNFVESTFETNRLDFVLIADSGGKIIYSKLYDKEAARLVQLPLYLADFFKENSSLLKVGSEDEAVKGLYILPENILMMSAEPILNNAADKPAAGTLIFGRFLDVIETEYLSETTNMNLVFFNMTLNKDGNLLKNAIKEISSGKEYYIDYKSRGLASAYLSLKSYNSSPSLLLNIDFPRNIYLEGLNSVIRFSVLSALLIILTFILVIFLLRKLFLVRLARLEDAVNKIKFEGSYTLNIYDKSNDEIGRLTSNIKNILEKINQSREKITLSEEKYRALFENSIDGISIRSEDGKFIDLNNSLVKMLGYDTKEQLLELDISKDIYVNESDFLKINSLENNSAIVRIKKSSGNIIWAEVTPRKVKDSKNGIYYENIVRNVTSGIEKEEEIKYLNFYDKLTGLYNRVYFEKKVKKIDNKAYFPLAIIVIDINGLRLINDTFGSEAGNQVIINIADGLKNSCRQEEIIARWGGDEFIIALRKTSEKDAANVSERIIKNCSSIIYKNSTVNVSLGYSIKNNENEDLHDVITEAENRMLRHKLFELDSASSSAILSLERALWEKSNETEEHAERLKILALEIGRKINLQANMLDDLKLLASLHDIGKLAVSDTILSKKTKLSKKEWEIIKKHPEIGYQIAKSSPQLAHIAEYILYHHEWWDGSGYPTGIKGEEIPLISRLLSLVDAYDVMSAGRSYKPPFTIFQSIDEINKFSGSQFDPELTKIFIKILEDKIKNPDKEPQ
jgi:diguanylate cyclase (GGDEF)-like protein/PAS domain S-box-containing protein